MRLVFLDVSTKAPAACIKGRFLFARSNHQAEKEKGGEEYRTNVCAFLLGLLSVAQIAQRLQRGDDTDSRQKQVVEGFFT